MSGVNVRGQCQGSHLIVLLTQVTQKRNNKRNAFRFPDPPRRFHPAVKTAANPAGCHRCAVEGGWQAPPPRSNGPVVTAGLTTSPYREVTFPDEQMALMRRMYAR